MTVKEELKQKTAKEELKQIYELDKRIISIHDSIIETETKLTHITPILSDMPAHHGGTDKMTDGVARLIELKEELNLMIDKNCLRRSAIMKKIDRLENETYKTILTQRYINCKSFEEISIMYPYTYNHTCKLHGYALQEYTKLMSQDSNVDDILDK